MWHFKSRALQACTFSLLLVVSQAHAGWICSGSVTDLTVDPWGSVLMSLQKPDKSYVWTWKILCNVQQASNGIQPQVCKIVYGTLVTSIALNRTVTFWFDYPNATTPDCSPTRFSAWSVLATDGSSPWYFGPKLD